MSKAEALAAAFAKHVVPMFAPQAMFTLIVRIPGDDEADVMISNDLDTEGIVASVRRSAGREQVALRRGLEGDEG